MNATLGIHAPLTVLFFDARTYHGGHLDQVLANTERSALLSMVVLVDKTDLPSPTNPNQPSANAGDFGPPQTIYYAVQQPNAAKKRLGVNYCRTATASIFVRSEYSLLYYLVFYSS